MTRQEFEARIISKAWKDEAFRARLKADPKAVVSEELASLHGEASIPANVKVTLLEETADQMYLVLPLNPNDFHDDEFTEEQLMAIAGGGAPSSAAAGTNAVAVVSAAAVTNIAGPTLDIVQVVTVAGPSVVVC